MQTKVVESIRKPYDVVIIGAGAAGLFCAAQFQQSELSVAILDNGKKIGRKILMSGGGNCNFTNYDVTAEHYLCQNPHFVKSALARYNQWDFIGLVAKYGIDYHEKELGQLFCDNGAKQIVDMLINECKQAKVDILLRHEIELISQLDGSDAEYQIEGKNAQSGNVIYQAKNLVIATGGLSMPALGATSFGYKIAKQFALNTIPPRASLVPFTWREIDENYIELAGISLSVTITAKSGHSFHNHLLFTHRGISGPAVLQITNYWQPTESVEIDLLPSQMITDYLLSVRQTAPNMHLKTALSKILPKRLIELWDGKKKIVDKVVTQLSNQDLSLLDKLIHHWQFEPNGTEGYRAAEVTYGGVDTADISSKTMQAKHVDKLYFIGEVLDVTGWLGGYNFQWAWSSAYACGQAIIEDCNK